jgi:hypothetical protein
VVQEAMNEQVFKRVQVFVSFEINSLSDHKEFEAKLVKWGFRPMMRSLWTGDLDPNQWSNRPLIPLTVKNDLMQGLDLGSDQVLVIFVEGPISVSASFL